MNNRKLAEFNFRNSLYHYSKKGYRQSILKKTIAGILHSMKLLNV